MGVVENVGKRVFFRIATFDGLSKTVDFVKIDVMSELTPMMKQYYDAKEASKGALLLFRMGDF